MEFLVVSPICVDDIRCYNPYGLRLSIKASKIALTDREFLLNVDYEFGSGRVIEFLSKELSMPKSNIVEGKITF